jgi:Holliday junction DNA helicase RuvA
VQQRRAERLEQIPGIGKKTAARLVLELGDKLPAEPATAGAEDSGADALRPDALSALINLGYPRDAATRAVDRALTVGGSAASLQQVLRSALSGLVR